MTLNVKIICPTYFWLLCLNCVRGYPLYKKEKNATPQRSRFSNLSYAIEMTAIILKWIISAITWIWAGTPNIWIHSFAVSCFTCRVLWCYVPDRHSSWRRETFVYFNGQLLLPPALFFRHGPSISRISRWDAWVFKILAHVRLLDVLSLWFDLSETWEFPLMQL